MTTFKLFGVSKAIMWVLGQNDVVGTGGIDGVATALPLGSGQGTAYAGSTPTNPHKIMVGSEIMYVTARSGDNLTVQRARDSTTAAAHIAGVAVRHLIPVRIPKTNAFDMDANITTIEFPGDGDVERVFESDGVSGTVGFSKLATELLERLGGITAIVSGLHSDEASRYHPEDGTYPYGELHIDHKAENEDSGANGRIRTIIYLCKIQDPLIIGAAGNNEAQGTEFAWSSQGTDVDIWGLPIPGIDDLVHYAYAVLS